MYGKGIMVVNVETSETWVLMVPKGIKDEHVVKKVFWVGLLKIPPCGSWMMQNTFSVTRHRCRCNVRRKESTAQLWKNYSILVWASSRSQLGACSVYKNDENSSEVVSTTAGCPCLLQDVHCFWQWQSSRITLNMPSFRTFQQLFCL